MDICLTEKGTKEEMQKEQKKHESCHYFQKEERESGKRSLIHYGLEEAVFARSELE